MLLSSGKTEVRKTNKHYPWELLSEIGDYFIWSDRSDAFSIRSNAKNKGVKVSVKTLEDRTIMVQRVG